MRNMRLITLGAAAAVAAQLPAPAVAAGEIISPVAATASAQQPGPFGIANAFNQSGLLMPFTSGTTNFNSYIAGDPKHQSTTTASYAALTATAFAVFDLGSAQLIDALAIWSLPPSTTSGTVNVTYSTDNTVFAGLLSGFTPVGQGGTDSADTFSFSTVTARYVRFDMSGCGTYCTIGEVAFRVAPTPAPGGVPEPGTWAMMIGGFGGVGAAMRRRRRVAGFA